MSAKTSIPKGKSLQSATAWSAVDKWASQLFGLVTLTVMARLLAPSDFGLVAIAMVYIAFADLVAEQGLGSALIQRRELDEKHKSTAFVCSIGLGLILTLGTWVLAPFIANMLGDPRVAPVIQGLSLRLLLLPLTSVQQALLRKVLDYRSLSIRSVLSQLAGGLLGIGMALNGCGAWSLVGQQLASAATSTCLLWWIGPWKPSLHVSRVHFKELYSFSIWVQIRNFFLYLSKNVDNAVIAFVLGTATLGAYTVAFRLMQQVLGAVSGLFGNVSFPYLSQAGGDLAEVRKRYSLLLGISATLAFPVFFGLIVGGEEVFALAFGHQWAASVPVFQSLCISGMILTVSYFFNGLSLALGHPRWPVSLLVARTVLIVVSILLVAQDGLVAISIAIGIALFISLFFELLAIQVMAKLSIVSVLRILYPSFVSAGGGAFAAFMVATQLFGNHPLILLLAKSLILLAVYVALFRLLSKKTFRDYQQYIAASGRRLPLPFLKKKFQPTSR